MDDREVVAAILAGDPAGLATAYDKYAAPIYGYCRWMLREPAAAEALQDTFVISSAQIHNLRDAGQLRSWLYTAARDECSHPPRVMGSGLDDMGQADDADPDASHAAERAEVRRLIRTVLTWLKPAEREVIELGIRHGLDDTEIAAVLGVSWSRAHALSAHARAQLEKTLGAMLMARTRRKACPALNGLLADWDGQPTIQLADIVGRHVDECETCASRKHGGLRPEVLAGLLPLAPLPPVLREQVLLRAGTRTNTDAAAEATADVPAPTPPEDEDPSGNRRAVKLVGWARIKRNPGRATAAVVVLLWVVAALSATIITLTGTHSATALTAQTHARPTATSTPSVSAAATASATPRTSRSPRPSTKPSTGGLAPAFVPTRTASATKKASPKPSSPASASASASSSASPTPTHKPSPKPSSTPTPTSTASPAPSDTST